MKSEVELGSHVNELDSFASELRNCVKSRGGRPELPVPNSPYGISVDVKQHCIP